ncbi:MAG: cytochrome c [Methylacidiphilales bacterium]|nr:cytochrome c [Candidatus Methylacidiphilales bacterium]
MKSKIQILLITACMILSAAAVHAADGKALYDANCASCHGKDGSGNTPMGKKFGLKNYQDAGVQAALDDATATKVIQDGKDKMKAFKDKLSADDIKAVIAHIRTFKK